MLAIVKLAHEIVRNVTKMEPVQSVKILSPYKNKFVNVIQIKFYSTESANHSNSALSVVSILLQTFVRHVLCQIVKDVKVSLELATNVNNLLNKV